MLLIMITAFVACIGYSVSALKPASSEISASIISIYEEKWDLQFPTPVHHIDIWYNTGWFGDGEAINVFYYENSKPNMQEYGMSLLSEQNIKGAKSRIDSFIATTITLYDETTNVRKTLEQYPVEVQAGDYYTYTSKNNGRNYFIALYKTKEKALYTFEWNE